MTRETSCFPIQLTAQVVRGFGRGSKELGTPTGTCHTYYSANLCPEAIDYASSFLSPGIYYGYAKLTSELQMHPMVLSLGWNPFYNNTKKSMEGGYER